jgi:hypothetical protein
MGQIVTVDFKNDTLFAAQRDDGVFIALKPISDDLGLKWNGQFERLQRDPILSEGIRTIRMPSVGGTQETTCLRLDLVNGWLFGIDESRVKDEEVRQRVLAYKRECYGVLFKHFYGRSLDDRKGSLGIDGDPDMEEPINVKRQLVTEARQSFGVQSAREMWFKMGLPTVPSMYADPRQGDFFTYTAIKRDPPSEAAKVA